MKDRTEGNQEDRFDRVANKAEKSLVKLIYILLAVLFLAQSLLQSNAVRGWVTKVDALEGKPYIVSPDR